jgi:hypothetical protein
MVNNTQVATARPQSCRLSVPWMQFRHSKTPKHSSVWRKDRAITLCDRQTDRPVNLRDMQQLRNCSNYDQQSDEELEELRGGIHKRAHTHTHTTVKYLGLHFDCKLNCKEYTATKKKQTDLKTKEIN